MVKGGGFLTFCFATTGVKTEVGVGTCAKGSTGRVTFTVVERGGGRVLIDCFATKGSTGNTGAALYTGVCTKVVGRGGGCVFLTVCGTTTGLGGCGVAVAVVACWFITGVMLFNPLPTSWGPACEFFATSGGSCWGGGWG